MNLIYKSMFLMACFAGLTCAASNSGKKNSDAQTIQELMDKIKKEYNAYDADETINDIVQKTLKGCGITRPVIVLQSHETDDAYTIAYPHIHPQEFMMIGVKGQALEQITSTIYHEVGHVAHGDVLKKRKFNDTMLVRGLTGSSLLTGLGVGLGFQRYIKKMPIVSSIAGTLTASAVLISGALMLKWRNSLKERRADVFAYENLIKHNKLNTAIIQISDYMCTHNFYAIERGITPLPSFLSGYPNNLQRAKIGLDVLQQQGINVSHLIKNLPEDLDQGIKEVFPDQIKQFFPDFA